jgi:molybdate transport system substrate-binding protein
VLRKLLLIALSSLYVSCAHAAELIVSAAASLTNAFGEVGKLFEANHPQDKVTFNFASSGALLAQIAKGAPADVFASADMVTMDRAEKQNLLAPGTRRNLLHNKLVLIAPAASTISLSSLASLGNAAVRRVAIGNPAAVPAGRYAKAALEAAGLWSKLEPKHILAQNVRQALDYVARGEVDAGIVYATDAAIMKGKVRVAAEIPLDEPIAYPVAIVKDTRNRALADAFSQMLQSPAAQAIFTRYGFSQPNP